jgi:hypothetical protein
MITGFLPNFSSMRTASSRSFQFLISILPDPQRGEPAFNLEASGTRSLKNNGGEEKGYVDEVRHLVATVAKQ